MNIDDIPSAKERREHKEAISHLEIEFSTETLRIQKLKEELEQRRALAAPIRMVPSDILSHIFLIYCGQERSAPLVLAAVCRRWRKTMLSTPLAWSRIFLYSGANKITPPSTCIAMFLQRSKPCLLHIGIKESPRSCDCHGRLHRQGCACYNAEIMLKDVDRIRCLLIQHEWMSTVQTSKFPNLEKLRITGTDWGSSQLVSIDMSLFPCLRHLDISGWAGLNNVVDFSLVQVPQLQYVSIKTDKEGHWHRLIRLNSSTLRTLQIDGRLTHSAERDWVLDCPQLERLFIKDITRASPTRPMVFEIIAPCLTFCDFISFHGGLKLVFRTDLENLVQLRTNDRIPRRQYPCLRILQFYDYLEPLFSFLDQLEEDYSLCPKLQAIKFLHGLLKRVSSYEADPARSRIADRNMLAGSCIEFIFEEPNSGPERWKYAFSTDDATVSICHSSFIN